MATLHRRFLLLSSILFLSVFASLSEAAPPAPEEAGRFVTVTGTVNAPGKIPWTADLTLAEALQRADLSVYANGAYLTRGTKRSLFSLRRVFESFRKGRPTGNPTLEAGDTIEVFDTVF